VEYRGIVQGMTIAGTVQRKQADDASQKIAGLLGSSETNPSVLMWIAYSGDKIHVLERNAKNDSKIYEFYRV